MIKEALKEHRPVVIILLCASLFVGYKTNLGYFIDQSSTDGNLLWFLFVGLGTSDMAFYGFNPSVFFGAFGIALLISVLLFIVFCINRDTEKRARVGHEHGKKRIGTKEDIKNYQKKFMEHGIFLTDYDRG